MLIKIDQTSGRAVYLQIVDQVKHAVAVGKLAPDSRLPTIRQLAAELVINPNTIAKAYRQLESEGIVASRPGAGAFIVNTDSALSLAVRKKLMCELIDRLLVEAIHMNIDRPTLESWISECARKFNFELKKEIP
ncbi:MAG: hypothetical protein A2Y07_06080 [Planctomycetes bacterium GWF2_50_10]|nr:MAG: hypothetical protein A2Y07_06080 [Planctomycetes bacterium GWF2_50_10]